MAFVFVDSFDHYSSAQILRKWDANGQNAAANAPVIGVTGRFGTSGVLLDGAPLNTSIDGWLRKFVANLNTYVVGCAWLVNNLSTGYRCILDFQNATGSQIQVRQYADGTLKVYRGATLLGTTAAGTGLGVYRHLEAKVTIDPAAGAVVLRVSGIEVLNLAGVNTQNQGAAGITIIGFGGDAATAGPSFPTRSTLNLDDVVIISTIGATPTDFIGDVRIRALLPTGAGTYSEWTPSAGSNFQNVDETPTNDDTDYNSTSTLNARDTYTFPAVAASAGSAIKGVAVNMMARKDDAGTRTAAAMVRQGGVDGQSTDIAVTGAYTNLQGIFSLNPATAAAFTLAQVNAMEAGIRLTT